MNYGIGIGYGQREELSGIVLMVLPTSLSEEV